jgi:hypothetical protein
MSAFEWLTGWHGWDWHGWDAMVAVGTITLAGVTFYLAMKTRADVGAALRSAETSERALAASLRPLIADVPLDETGSTEADVFAEGADVRIYVPLRNVGAGLALLSDADLDFGEIRRSWDSSTLQSAVPAGEGTRLDFVVKCHSPDDAETVAEALVTAGRFWVDVRYRDMDGRQPMLTRATIAYYEGETLDDWYVDEVAVFRDGEADPFVTVPTRSTRIVVGG